jgi:hypothetical protein
MQPVAPIRRSVSQVRPAPRQSPEADYNSPPPRAQVTAFQYIGTTALTAIGPVSGRQYRFSHPGAVLEVDPRDMASLVGVPKLQQVRVG